jgi:HEAT repeat protein
MAAMTDQDENVRALAAFALGQICAPEAVESLTMALQDPSSAVRRNAVISLGQIGDQRAITALRAVQEGDKDQWVANPAADAIKQIQRRQQ